MDRQVSFVNAGKAQAWDIEDVAGNHNFLCGHVKNGKFFLAKNTNMPEFEKLRADPTMEAIKDRMVRVDVPYLREWSEECKVLQQDYGAHKVQTHIAPHTLEITALFGVLTRLEPANKTHNVAPVVKAKLYDGKLQKGWTEEKVKELIDGNSDEGMKRGMSARHLQNAIANALVNNNYRYINPFMVLHEIDEKIKNLMVNDEKDKDWYRTCLAHVKDELQEILKVEVQRALVADPQAIERLFSNYMDNVMAYVERAKIVDPFTRQPVPPNESLMRSIEEMADVPEPMADDWRRQLATFKGGLAHKKKEMTWDSNQDLARALEKKLFEDSKDTIKLSAMSRHMSMDKDEQAKIDAIKQRMCDNHGYTPESAADVLEWVASIFSRGEVDKS